MKKIITISREFGAAGGTIGQLVAKRLGYEYVDKELVIQAARDALCRRKRKRKAQQLVNFDGYGCKSSYTGRNSVRKRTVPALPCSGHKSG